MGQSLVKNYIHIIFSTKHREPLIQPPHELALHAYLGSTCRELGCPVITVGGYTDHIHILCMLSQKIPLMTLVQKIKANSSKWMKTRNTNLENFYWQNGYGAFSVNYNRIEIVENYIKNQHTHHTKETYKQEYRTLLKKHKITYDEKYVWD